VTDPAAPIMADELRASLDGALARLSASDRSAVAIRYLQRRPRGGLRPDVRRRPVGPHHATGTGTDGRGGTRSRREPVNGPVATRLPVPYEPGPTLGLG
jgi:hypothetical protein